MELIVRETNIYAQQLATTMLDDGTIRPKSRITRWQYECQRTLHVSCHRSGYGSVYQKSVRGVLERL